MWVIQILLILGGHFTDKNWKNSTSLAVTSVMFSEWSLGVIKAYWSKYGRSEWEVTAGCILAFQQPTQHAVNIDVKCDLALTHPYIGKVWLVWLRPGEVGDSDQQ